MSRKKQIVIIGLGHFGHELAVGLARHAEVLAIDADQDVVDEIGEKVQRALALDIRDQAAIGAAISPDFDEAVISMGENLEASILCTLYLKRMGIPVIRAKALNDDHAAILRQLGATQIIFPERETAQRVAAQILNPGLLDFIPLGGGYQVSDLVPPEHFYGKSLADLHLRARFDVFVIAVKKRLGEAFVFLPGPTYIVSRGDVLVMIGRQDDLLRVEEPE